METEECDSLITAVYRRPALYDESNKLYFNRIYDKIKALNGDTL